MNEEAEERRRATALLGSVITPKKLAALRENAKKGGRPRGWRAPEETRTKQSEAMKAAWARRKAESAPASSCSSCATTPPALKTTPSFRWRRRREPLRRHLAALRLSK